MKTYRLGIDPGVSGALALLEFAGVFSFPKLIALADMPVMPLGKKGKKKQVNSSELVSLLIKWHRPELVVYLEQVQSMPGQGVSSMFNFGMGYGMIQGAIAALQLPMALVRPSAWKKRAGLLHCEKERSRTFAQQLFPGADLSLKKDVGRAEAILIAMFGKG